MDCKTCKENYKCEDCSDYFKCRVCLEYTFRPDESSNEGYCENCGFFEITKKNKKYYIKYPDKIKYVENLLRNHKTKIGPNSYLYSYDDKILDKYRYFLSYMYKIRLPLC